MRNLLLYLWIAVCAAADAQENELVVYRDVPGLAASDQYALRIRPMDDNQAWREAFAFITRCKEGIRGKNNYFSHLSGWSNTYINFEMARPVEVEIARTNGKPVSTAVVRPGRKASRCEVRGGKVYVTITKPCLVTVDIDGQMDEQDTGKGYAGPPIHTVTIFANPVLKDRPKPDAPGVLAVSPGTTPPSDGPWKTLYFLPGVHHIGVGFPVHANRNYFIPGDALVYGTMTNHGDWANGNRIRIFGYGTLSGAMVAHPKFTSPPPKNYHLHSPIHIVGAANTSVEGITLADSAYHSLMLIMPWKPEEPTDIRWVKIFTWRGNGDGINPFGNGHT